MVGSTHFLAGAVIGKLSGNPILAAVLGFVFHFAMDLVPHWDYGYHFKRKFWCFVIAAAEPMIGIAVFVWIVLAGNFSLNAIINMVVGGIFCLLPDAIGVIVRFFRLRFLRPLVIFHKNTHWFIDYGDKDIFDFTEIKISPKGIVLGLIYQIPFIIISLWFLVV